MCEKVTLCCFEVTEEQWSYWENQISTRADWYPGLVYPTTNVVKGVARYTVSDHMKWGNEAVIPSTGIVAQGVLVQR